MELHTEVNQFNCRFSKTKLMVKIWSFPPRKYQFRLSVIGYHQCYSWGLGYKESKTCIIFAVRISHSQWSEPSDIYPGHYTAMVSKNLRSIDKFNIKVGYEMKVLTSMGMPDTNFRNCSFCSNYTKWQQNQRQVGCFVLASVKLVISRLTLCWFQTYFFEIWSCLFFWNHVLDRITPLPDQLSNCSKCSGK